MERTMKKVQYRTNRGSTIDRESREWKGQNAIRNGVQTMKQGSSGKGCFRQYAGSA